MDAQDEFHLLPILFIHVELCDFFCLRGVQSYPSAFS
jgi:hypothetical protein